MIFNINSSRGQTRFLTCVARVTCLVYNMYRTIIRSIVEMTLSYPMSPISHPSSDEYNKYLSSPHVPPPSYRGISCSHQSSFLHYFYDRGYFNFLSDSKFLLAFPSTMMVSSVKKYHSCSSMLSATLSKQYRYYTIRAYSLSFVLEYLGRTSQTLYFYRILVPSLLFNSIVAFWPVNYKFGSTNATACVIMPAPVKR